MILSPGQSFNACARCCEEQSWHQPVGACPAWVTQPNSALFPLFLPDLHSSPQAPLLSLACSKLISYYCEVFLEPVLMGLAVSGWLEMLMILSQCRFLSLLYHIFFHKSAKCWKWALTCTSRKQNKWKTIQLALSLI